MIDPEIAKKVVSVLPPVTRPPLTRKRKYLALAFAGAVDLIQICLFPAFIAGGFEPPDDVIDIIAAIVLLIMCGPRWQFAMAFVLELVPGVALFPTWTTFVLALPVTSDTSLPPPSPNSCAAAQTDLPPAQQITSEVIRVGKP